MQHAAPEREAAARRRPGARRLARRLGGPARARAARTLQELRTLGVKVAVDDFGTGWSSLAALASSPVDILKLDRSFVAAMDDSPAHAELLDGVLAMAARLELLTVVEGIETQAQLDRVRAFGCRFMQGYFLGRPGPLPATRPARVA